MNKKNVDIFKELSEKLDLSLYHTICESKNLLFIVTSKYFFQAKEICKMLDVPASFVPVLKLTSEINREISLQDNGENTIIVIGHENAFIYVELLFAYHDNIKFYDENDLEIIYNFTLLLKSKLKINNMYDCLIDELSKNTIKNILLARITGDYNCIQSIRDTNPDNEYFDKSIIQPTEDESFIDAGSYIGDTLGKFLKFVNFNFEKAFLFEPDKNNFSALQLQIKKKQLIQTVSGENSILNIDKIVSKLKIYNLGVYDKRASLEFSGYIGVASHIKDGIDMKVDKTNNYNINAIKLDDVIDQSCNITMIKMDIEGCEEEALLGCREIIKRNKPRLMICIYHKPNHLWDIPLLIKNIEPSYELFIRHYGKNIWDTICYAIPK